MLYRNYDREDGEWIANEDGTSDNHDAIAFLEAFHWHHARLRSQHRINCGRIDSMAANHHRAEDGGLGFHRKWNMGGCTTACAISVRIRCCALARITMPPFISGMRMMKMGAGALARSRAWQSLLGRMPGDLPVNLPPSPLDGWQLAVPGVPLLYGWRIRSRPSEWDALGECWDEGLIKINTPWPLITVLPNTSIDGIVHYGRVMMNAMVFNGSTMKMPPRASSLFTTNDR